MKQVSGPVAGRDNWIFPDLNSGNIAFKLVHMLAGANTFGQIVHRPDPARRRNQPRLEAHAVFGAAAIVRLPTHGPPPATGH
ncbi:MAG: hypothetical protein IPP19_15740 [Verrucomicrobia bacterium]|nr:hypothetical protein [Verrucomicrobiota bacterium]